MKAIAYIVVLFFFLGCTSRGGSKESPISTVDSNTIGTADTTPSILYLDNPMQDSFPLALDSAGATIEPQDTQYTPEQSPAATE